VSSKREKHEEIKRKAPEILERVLKVKNKARVAKEFGLSIRGVDSALGMIGRWDLVARCYRARFGPKDSPPIPTKVEDTPKEESKKSTSSKEETTSDTIARALLVRVLESIHDTNQLRGELNSYKTRVIELEALLKKATEEKDRVIKIHNQIASETHNGRLPSLEEIVHAIRRDLRPGDKI